MERKSARVCQKPSQLETMLQQLTMPCGLNVDFEQYHTPPHIAANVLWEISQHWGSIRDEIILDLGCGSGILGIGCVLLGAKFVVGVDVDSKMIEAATLNAQALSCTEENIAFIKQDVRDLDLQSCLENGTRFDTVVMNPPFGARDQNGIDTTFVLKALENAQTVYSMHKTSTRQFWIREGIKLGVHVKPLTELTFNIERSYKFHKSNSVNIKVDLWQFKRMHH